MKNENRIERSYEVSQAEDSAKTSMSGADKACGAAEIPRVALRHRLNNQSEYLRNEIREATARLRTLEEFEKTFFALSESLQDGLAPQIIGNTYY